MTKLWLAPAFFGGILILIGMLIFAMPRLLEVLVAAVFILAGTFLIALAWQTRGRVSYHRMDDSQRD